MRTRLLTIIFLWIACSVSAQDDLFQQLIRQGIELHDQGQYESAIEKYQEALKMQPDSKLALYEIGFSYSLMKKYEESIAYGRKALASTEDRPDIDVMVYTMIGSNYDDIGQPEEALKLYDEGLAKEANYLLFFNKGLTLHRQNKLEEALACYKNALSLRISHPTSNLNTARIYLEANDIVSAFFYYIYFLLFEPNSERSSVAFQELFDSGKSHNITLPTGDQQMLHLTLSLAFTASNAQDKDGKVLEMSPYTKMLNIFKLLYSMKDNVEFSKMNDDICASYYAPMFFAACEDGYMELFCRYITYSLDQESQEWIEENDSKVDAFFIWINAFGRQDTPEIE